MSDVNVKLVKIGTTALLKIQKFGHDAANKEVLRGQLYGIYDSNEGVVEITNVIPLPAEGDFDDEKVMMEYFGEVNFDPNNVGWFQISSTHEHVLSLLVHRDYHLRIPCSVFLVYDLSELKKGSLRPFRAYRFSEKFDEFLSQERKESLIEKFTSLNLTYDKIFVEVPIEIVQSPWVSAFFCEHREALEKKTAPRQEYALPDFFQRNIQYLLEAIDENIDCEKKLVDINTKQLADQDTATLEESMIDFLASYSRLTELNAKVKKYGKYQLDGATVLEDLVKSNTK